MKKHYLFLAALIVVVVFSSCSGLRIEKRHYNKGFYVDFGSNNKTTAAVDNTETEPAVAVENTPQSVQENTARALNPNTPDGNEVRNSSSPSGDSYTDIVEPLQPTLPGAEVDQQSDVAQVENNTPPSEAPQDDVALILLVILAILLPPLAVFLVEGVSKWFWITLILCIFGGGVFFYPVIGGLWLISVIIALFVVFGLI